MPVWKTLDLLNLVNDEFAGIHLGIFTPSYLPLMESGVKTVESRWSKKWLPPYGRIDKGDVVFVKGSSGPVVSRFAVSFVKEFVLVQGDLERIKKEFGRFIAAPDAFFDQKIDSKFCTLIGISNYEAIDPIVIDKKDRRAWVVLRHRKFLAFDVFAKTKDKV